MPFPALPIFFFKKKKLTSLKRRGSHSKPKITNHVTVIALILLLLTIPTVAFVFRSSLRPMLVYAASIFTDDYETGNHNNWTGTTIVGTGSLAEVVSTNPSL